MIFYDLILLLLLLFYVPKLLFQSKYRKNTLQRFGIGFPKIEKGNRPLIWIHAVSVGETVAVAPLAKKLKERPDQPIIIITNVTVTGHAQAKRSLPFADYHLYLPFDFSWVIKPIVRRIKPDLVILCETDLWFNFLNSCKQVGAKLAVVNGKLSERSLDRYKKFSWFSKPLFALFDLFCVQSEHYKRRFQDLGIPKEKIFVTGNLKFDGDLTQPSLEEVNKIKKDLGVPESSEVFVVGSTHDPEEEMILNLLPALWDNKPNLTVILVPRHPERFSAVARMIQDKKIPFIQYSKRDQKTGNEKLILVDAMGLLRKCYQVSDLALVAGSFTQKVGGHNIIEPSWYGVPVLYGPHMHSQPELVELAKEHHIGLQIDPKELSGTVVRLFSTNNERVEMGGNGAAMVKKLQGATEKTEKYLREIADI